MFSVRKSWPRTRARPPGTGNVSTLPSRRRSASYWLKREEITPRWEGPEFETIKMNDYHKMLIKMLFTHVDGLTNQLIVLHHLKQAIFKVWAAYWIVAWIYLLMIHSSLNAWTKNDRSSHSTMLAKLECDQFKLMKYNSQIWKSITLKEKSYHSS